MTQTMTDNILTYNGQISFDIINEILHEYKKRVREFDLNAVVSKRIYSILVETLENAYRHKTEKLKGQNHKEIELSVNKLNDNIDISVGNYINPINIDKLKDKIDLINSLDLIGLNRLYRASISKARISEKGGAGLGLIEIARNSRYNLEYKISDEKGNAPFFQFFITISNNPNKEKTI